jgi:hypothetical protein
MSREPARWLDSAEQPELLQLMRVGADELAPADVLARVGARIRASAPASEVPVASPPSRRPPLVSTSGLGVKAVGIAVLLVALGLSLYLTVRSRPATPRRVETSSAEPRVLASKAQRIEAPSLAPAEPTTHDALPADEHLAPVARPAQADSARRPKKKRGEPPRESPSSPVVAPMETRLLEAKLLEQARKELAARPDHALALLRDHATQFPASWLEEERAALSIRALAATGQRTEARAELTQFEARFPGSLHTQRLERALTAP